MKSARQRVASVQERIVDLLDAWQAIIDGYQHDSASTCNTSASEEPEDAQAAAARHARHRLHHREPRKFRVNRSLRDVEPSVNLFLTRHPRRDRSRTTDGRARTDKSGAVR